MEVAIILVEIVHNKIDPPKRVYLKLFTIDY